YMRGGNPSNHSIAQRFAYLRAAGGIISQHFIFGVGTGDVQQAFNDYYSSHHSVLGQNNRRRAHNQYVTFFVTFGLIGFVVFLLSLFGPVFIEKRWNDYLFIVFFLLGLMSMLNEDTLETQTGVSFFMFFYCLFLFAR
ncbi:MAG TPA: O-antigen ligase family protein, partial [Bacteroidales bacterium]|nr:O-antigen ligase family protein [Bacteroidales bacterium]